MPLHLSVQGGAKEPVSLRHNKPEEDRQTSFREGLTPLDAFDKGVTSHNEIIPAGRPCRQGVSAAYVIRHGGRDPHPEFNSIGFPPKNILDLADFRTASRQMVELQSLILSGIHYFVSLNACPTAAPRPAVKSWVAAVPALLRLTKYPVAGRRPDVNATDEFLSLFGRLCPFRVFSGSRRGRVLSADAPREISVNPQIP